LILVEASFDNISVDQNKAQLTLDLPVTQPLAQDVIAVSEEWLARFPSMNSPGCQRQANVKPAGGDAV
jgi:hypothetical protein